MTGPEAHAAMLAAHATLRTLATDIDPVIRREIESPGSASSELRTKARALAVALRAHLEAEEQTLRPILRRLDAWGPERIDRMLIDHVKQRRAVAELLLLADRRRRNASTLARATCEFVDDMLADMEHEEKTTLPALLEDGQVILARQHAE
jgi:hypothetical protein